MRAKKMFLEGGALHIVDMNGIEQVWELGKPLYIESRVAEHWYGKGVYDGVQILMYAFDFTSLTEQQWEKIRARCRELCAKGKRAMPPWIDQTWGAIWGR